MRIVIAGAGIFGVTAAIELRRRGHEVALLDPGPLPHALAASTDISKVVRMEYGGDDDYSAMAEAALDGWRRWNVELGAPLFHEDGVMFLRRTPLAPGTFEGDSLALLTRRGHRLEHLDAAQIRARFPAWNAERYAHGIFNPEGGWVESGRVVEALVAVARAAGVTLHEGATLHALLDAGGRVSGISTSDGRRFAADCVVAALGSWTPHALPFTAPWFRSTAMPVFHLRPADPSRFVAARFPVFGADISGTGYYGFPIHPRAGVVKIANHGRGRLVHPSGPERGVDDDDLAALRAFLADAFPALTDAPVVATRACVYCDTWDGHFWIAADPERPGLVLATGGSGHAYKFAPLLGALVADAVDGAPRPKFRWRPESRPPRAEEAARFQEPS